MTIRNLWLILSAASSLCAATHHVTPETVSSLKSICEHARPGDDIVFHKGIYDAPFPHINCNGAPEKPITLTADAGEYATAAAIADAILHSMGPTYDEYEELLKDKALWLAKTSDKKAALQALNSYIRKFC